MRVSSISNLPSALMLSELDNYLQRLDNLRTLVADLITGLPAEALNWRPVAGEADHATNSLAALAAHIAGSEHFWMAEVVGQQLPTRNRPAEFATQADDAAKLCERLDAVGTETREILKSLSQEDLDGARQLEGRTVSVRWGILHVIDHTALHLGHMQLTYQLWHNGQSKPSPYWYSRLPRDNQTA